MRYSQKELFLTTVSNEDSPTKKFFKKETMKNKKNLLPLPFSAVKKLQACKPDSV